MDSEASICVSGSEGGALAIWLDGRLTMRESPVFEKFVASALPQDAGTHVFVELNECRYLDSTFLGCLVSLHKRFRGRFHLVAGEAASSRLLQACQLHRLFDFAPDLPSVQGEPVQLNLAGHQDPTALGAHVLDCHRQLMNLDCPSRAAFARIVQQLERELHAD